MIEEVHKYDDGLPPRRVYVDGKLIERVLVANVSKGFVEYAIYPYEVDGEDIKTARIEGKVVVELIPESEIVPESELAQEKPSKPVKKFKDILNKSSAKTDESQ